MDVVSTMGSGHLGCEVDLSELRETLSGDDISISSNPPSMMTFRLQEKGPAYSLYRTGTFQVRGASSPERLHRATNRVIDYLKSKGVPVSNPTFEHKTSVFLEDLDQRINLEVLAVTLGLERVEYEPEQFPGLVYRPDGIEATFLVFSTGKIIIGGTTDEDIAKTGIKRVSSALTEQ